MDNNAVLNIHERLAILEARREDDAATLLDIQEKVNAFHDEMVKYRGIVGAVTFLASALVVAVELLKDWFLSHWK